MTKAKRLQMSSRWETHSPSNGDVGWHGGLLGLIRNQNNFSPPFHQKKKKKKSKYLYYSFITCIFNEKDKISYHLV